MQLYYFINHQTSLLYTNNAKQRILRVHNYAVPVSFNESDIFAGLDYQSTVCMFVKKHISQMSSQIPLADINKETTNKFKSLMKIIASSTNQITQSELIPYLSLALLGIHKHLIFRAQDYDKSQNSIIDYINWLKIIMNKMPVDILFKQINPLLFDLSNLINQTYCSTFCEINEEIGFEYPLTIDLSYEQAQTKQLLLMDDGLSLNLVIMNCSTEIINKLFK